VALALPLLDAMLPNARSAPQRAAQRRRMVAVCTGLGVHAPLLFPEKAGRDYAPTPYLKELEAVRDQLTICSGLSHPLVDGGHSSEASFLTAAPHPGSSSFRNAISFDQMVAERLRPDTRFASLTLSTGNRTSLSWSRTGVRVPADEKPSQVFARLFLDGSAEEVRGQVRKLRDGQSIMDTVRDDAGRMNRELGQNDRDKLDEYFNSVRELEQRLVRGEEWVKRPKPKAPGAPPRDIASPADTIGRTRLMYDLIHLAIQTDSTRIITLFIAGMPSVPPIPGVNADWHNLSHHGKDPAKIAQLRLIETEHMKALHDLLVKLQGSKEEDETLLDRTMVLFGANMGNASSHDTKNLPILLAGGGFKHGAHLAFDQTNNAPLCNLFMSMAQRLGLEMNSFASSAGALRGLEMKG
jgi:Protein of unknown function (DUF1552)